MARARNIKPSFFANDDLADIHPLGRLLFIGLWTLADREGRLEDRPRRIKAEVLPYDECNVDSLLDDLQSHGFILRYEVDGDRFIQVVNFTKHQNPHVKESASSIPAPGEHRTSTVQEQCEEQPEPERAGLIPDSPSLIPESNTSNPEGLVSGSTASSPRAPVCPHQEIIDLYHEILPMGTQVRVWNSARSKSLQARWREDPKRQDLDWWRRFFEYIAESEFLTGRTQPAPGRDPFVVSLDWLVAPKNFAKVIEGRYHRECA